MADRWYMDDAEILSSYRSAKDKREQVKILAELNLKSRKDVKSKLRELGEDVPDNIAPTATNQKIDVQEVQKLFSVGLTDNEIASALNVSVVTVEKCRHENGMLRTDRSTITKSHKRIDEELVAALLEQGFSDTEIARRIDVERHTLTRWRQSRGLLKTRGRTSKSCPAKKLKRTITIDVDVNLLREKLRLAKEGRVELTYGREKAKNVNVTITYTSGKKEVIRYISRGSDADGGGE